MTGSFEWLPHGNAAGIQRLNHLRIPGTICELPGNLANPVTPQITKTARPRGKNGSTIRYGRPARA
jgi:hypothetical protein